jgi:uncharacterized membrane protein
MTPRQHSELLMSLFLIGANLATAAFSQVALYVLSIICLVMAVMEKAKEAR